MPSEDPLRVGGNERGRVLRLVQEYPSRTVSVCWRKGPIIDEGPLTRS